MCWFFLCEKRVLHEYVLKSHRNIEPKEPFMPWLRHKWEAAKGEQSTSTSWADASITTCTFHHLCNLFPPLSPSIWQKSRKQRRQSWHSFLVRSEVKPPWVWSSGFHYFLWITSLRIEPGLIVSQIRFTYYRYGLWVVSLQSGLQSEVYGVTLYVYMIMCVCVYTKWKTRFGLN